MEEKEKRKGLVIRSLGPRGEESDKQRNVSGMADFRVEHGKTPPEERRESGEEETSRKHS